MRPLMTTSKETREVDQFIKVLYLYSPESYRTQIVENGFTEEQSLAMMIEKN